MSVGMLLVGEQRRVRPCGLAIRAPIAPERPPRQLFAGIPLALAHVHETIRAVSLLQPEKQIGRTGAFGRSERRRVPLFAVAIGHRDERRLPAHRQTHVAGGQIGVNRAAAGEDRRPLPVGVRLGDARRLDDALHRHPMEEVDLAGFDSTR